MDRELKLNLVVGAALGKSYAKVFSNATKKVKILGSSLAKSKDLRDSIGRFKQLKKTVGNTAQEMKLAQNDVSNLARKIKSTDKPSKQMVRNFEQAKKKSARLKEAHQKQTHQLHKLRKEMRGAGVDTRNLIHDEKRLGQSFDKTRKKLDRLNKAQAGKQRAEGRFGALKGRALGAIGLAYGASRMIGGSFDLEDKKMQLGDVITGKNREARLQASLQHARLFSKKSLASEADVLEIDYALRSSGLDDKAAQFGSEIVSKVATVTKGSASDVGFIIGDVFTNMSAAMEGSVEDKLKRIGDVLTKTKNLFSIKDFNQLGEGLKEGLSGAIANNVSLEETAALIGQINNGMLKGSQAGTGLNAMLRQLPKASEDLGFEIIRDNNGALDVIATLEGLKYAMDDITDIDEKAMMLQKSFGDEGKKALVPLLANLDALKKNFVEVRDKADGTFDEGYQRRIKSASGQWLMFKQNAGQVGTTLANTLLPSINAVLTPVVKLMGWVATGIEKFPVLGYVVGGLATAFMIGATAIGVVTAAQWLWNAALLANPIGLVIAGVATLAAGAWLIYDNWDAIGTWFGGVITGMGIVLNETWSGVTQWFNEKTASWMTTFTDMSSGLKKAWQSISEWFGKKLDWIKGKVEFIGDAWNSIFGGDDQTTTPSSSGQTRRKSRKHIATVAAASIATAMPVASMAQPTQITNTENYQITMQQQPGQNTADLVDEFEREIKRRKAQRSRSAMGDQGDLE